MPKRNRDHLSIVEACYRTASNDQTWLREILVSAAASLGFGPDVGLMLIQEKGHQREVTLADAGSTAARATVRAWAPLTEQLPASVFRGIYYPRTPVLHAAPLSAKFPAACRPAWHAALELAGSDGGLMGLLGHPAPDWAFSMYVCLDHRRKVGTQLRRAFHRIRIHVESGLRLRILKPTQAAAVLDVDGRVLDLARQPSLASNEIQRQVKGIERARTGRERHSEHSMEIWTALVRGQWSLVEHHDTDGKRIYFAYENLPLSRAYRALTACETTVLDQSIRGLPPKHIAYACGMEPSRISEQLESAATKLGFSTRQDLLRVACRLRHTGNLDLLDCRLSLAEVAVLTLVREGLSNKEISERRKTSERTVANQVASLLSKTSLPNRNALSLLVRPELSA